MSPIRSLSEILGERPRGDSLVRAIGPVSRPSLGMALGHLPHLQRRAEPAPPQPPRAPEPPPQPAR